MITDMFRKYFIVIVLWLFACGETYGQSGGAVYCDSVFYKLVLWDFSFNGLYVPLRVKTDNVMCYALLSNDYLSLYIKRKLELDESDNKSYVVFMKQILENQGILDISGNDFEFYGFEKVTIDSNLVKEVEKNRMKFIKKYFNYAHYFYYYPDNFANSDSVIYKEEVKSYTIRQDIPYEKQLCIIYLLLERNVVIYTISGNEGGISYIGPYKDSPVWGMKWRRIKGKRAVRLSRKYGL